MWMQISCLEDLTLTLNLNPSPEEQVTVNVMFIEADQFVNAYTVVKGDEERLSSELSSTIYTLWLARET